MTGLLICAAVVALMGLAVATIAGGAAIRGETGLARGFGAAALALIAAALYLAWRAGGAG